MKFTIKSEGGSTVEYDTATMTGIVIGFDDEVFEIIITEKHHAAAN